MSAPEINVPSFENASITGDDLSEKAIPTRADVTVHVMSDIIAALGVIGAASIAERASTADVTVEGILSTLSGWGTNLKEISESEPRTIVINGGKHGKSCTIVDAVVTSINFTFTANADCTTSWGYLGHSTGFTAGSGEGVEKYGQLSSIQGEDVLAGTNVEGITSVTFDATIDREEIYFLGYRDPVRPPSHPFTVTVTITAQIPDMSSYNDSWTWAYPGENPISVAFCTARYLRPTDGGLSIDTGATPTITKTLVGFELEF